MELDTDFPAVDASPGMFCSGKLLSIGPEWSKFRNIITHDHYKNETIMPNVASTKKQMSVYVKMIKGEIFPSTGPSNMYTNHHTYYTSYMQKKSITSCDLAYELHIELPWKEP